MQIWQHIAKSIYPWLNQLAGMYRTSHQLQIMQKIYRKIIPNEWKGIKCTGVHMCMAIGVSLCIIYIHDRLVLFLSSLTCHETVWNCFIWLWSARQQKKAKTTFLGGLHLHRHGPQSITKKSRKVWLCPKRFSLYRPLLWGPCCAEHPMEGEKVLHYWQTALVRVLLGALSPVVENRFCSK